MKIKEETRAALQALFMPPVSGVVPGADDESPSEEDLVAHKAWCEDRIREELIKTASYNAEVVASWDESVEGRPLPEYYERAMVRTHYTSDDYESEDVLALDEDGNIVIIDAGSR